MHEYEEFLDALLEVVQDTGRLQANAAAAPPARCFRHAAAVAVSAKGTENDLQSHTTPANLH